MIKDKRKTNSGRKPIPDRDKLKDGITVYEKIEDIYLLGGKEVVRELFHKVFEKELNKLKKAS